MILVLPACPGAVLTIASPCIRPVLVGMAATTPAGVVAVAAVGVQAYAFTVG